MIEQVAHQVVHLEYINTVEHAADACTKALSGAPFKKLRGYMLGPQRARNEHIASQQAMDV